MKKFILTLTAIFICTIAYAHTINWHVGNTILQTTTCDSGDSITPPTQPYKYGYHFIRWDGYTPIEYLESTGTQYIDTGIIPDNDFGLKTKIRYNKVDNGTAYPFGAGQSFLELYNWNNHLEYFYFGNQRSTGPVVSVGDIVEIDWNKNHVDYTINTIQQPTILFSYLIETAPYTMHVFATKRSNGIAKGYLRIYYFKLYNNGTLVRDFIPVLDSNNVPCMFDKVEKKFYYNAGTGQFIAGPVIGE